MFKRPYRKIIYRKKVKILLIQIVNRNLGDQVIADNAEYLVRRALPRLARQHYMVQHYDIQSEDWELLRTADLIIFAGGGLVKYRQEDFHMHVPAILECAQECGIPVYFNCVGVEGYDAQDARCMRLARTLNYDCIKTITVRDDLETLRRDYLKTGRIVTAAAVDPAVFTQQVYGIRKDTQSRTIGLGVVRHRIFEDYGIAQVTREFQLEMWQGITKELEARGYQWKFYVNGLRSDYDFALEILEYMGRGAEASKLLAPRPVQAGELVGLTASFAGVIACRMHANIIAYALGIASVGLVWNDKMVFWGERIGCPERFLTSGQFEPKRIVQCLMDGIAAGVKPCPEALKKSVQRPLQKFVHRYGGAAWKKNRAVHLKKPMDWAGRLAAAALGGISMRYTNMNAAEGLEGAIRHGFRIFEADIRLSRDRKLVCVNGWSKGSYEKLGAGLQTYADGLSGGKTDHVPAAGHVPAVENTQDMPAGTAAGYALGMDADTFLECRMYGHYQTMDAEQLFARMRRETGDWKLILDIGKPKKEILADMIEQLRGLCGEEPGMEKHLLIRLQSKYDVEAVQEAGLPMQVMYYVPPRQVREEKNITLEAIGKYCKKRRLQWVSMPKETLDQEVMEFLHKQKLKSCLFSYNRYTDIIQAAELGVDWIATSYLRVDELAEWYEAGYTIVIR